MEGIILHFKKRMILLLIILLVTLNGCSLESNKNEQSESIEQSNEKEILESEVEESKSSNDNIADNNNSTTEKNEDSLNKSEEENISTDEKVTNNKSGLSPFKENRLWGYKNENNETIIKPQFIEANEFSEGLAYVQGVPNVGPGFINTKGEMLFNLFANEVFPFKEGKSKIIIDSHTGFIDKKGNLIYNEKSQLIPIKSRYGWIYITKDDEKIAIMGDFVEADEFINGVAVVKLRDGYAYINKKGEYVLKELQEAYPFDDNKALAMKNNEWAYYDKNGEKIELKYNDDGLAEINLGEKIGFIDQNKQIVKNEDVSLKLWEYNGKYGYMDQKDKIVVTPKYYEATPIENNIGMIKGNGNHFYKKWSFIDDNGEEIIEPQFDEVTEFGDNNIAAVKKNGKWGYIDRKGEYIINLILDSIEKFSDSQAKISYNSLNGLIDSDGKFIFDEDSKIMPYRFEINNGTYRYGYVTKNNKKIVEMPKYEYTGEFKNGLSLIKDEEYLGYYNSSGQIQLETKFSQIRDYKEEMAAVKTDGQWGFIDDEANIVIKAKYDYVNDFDNSKAKIIDKNMYAYINKDGEIVEDFKTIESIDQYTYDNIDELLDIINNYIHVANEELSEEMIFDLISVLKSNTMKDYENFKTKGEYSNYLFNYYIKDNELFYSDYFIDYNAIKDNYGEYLSKEFNRYLAYAYESKNDSWMHDAVITIPIEKLAERLLKYEDFVNNNQEFPLINTLYDDLYKMTKVFIYPYSGNMAGIYITGNNQPSEDLLKAYEVVLDSNLDAPIVKEAIGKIVNALNMSDDNSFDDLDLKELGAETVLEMKNKYE